MNRLVTPLLLLLLNFQTFAQLDGLRYRTKRFESVTRQLDVTYGQAPQWIFPYWNETLKMDIYQPTGDTLSKRPLLIFAHSGGFLNGSKDVDDMVAICDSFGQKGYVTASIAYRKGFNPLDGESCERAVYRAIQDGKTAVRFFKDNANLYGIDTNFIYFGGMSAGGFIALHVGYMDEESERPQSTYGGGTVNNLGCLDCSGRTSRHSSKVRGILDYWGAMQDTTMITRGDIPCLIMHGQNDGTVPHNTGHPFGVSTIPVTMGGGPIFQRLQNQGVYSEYYTSYGPNHMLDGSDNGTFPASGPNSYWSDTLLPRTTSFLITTMKPNPTKLTADTLYACVDVAKMYSLQLEQPNHQVKWLYPSTSNITANSAGQSLSISSSTAGYFPISALVFNEVLCASDTIHFMLIVDESPTFEILSTDLSNNTYHFETSTQIEVEWFINTLPYSFGTSVEYRTSVVDTLFIMARHSSTNSSCLQNRALVIHHNGLLTNTLPPLNWSIFPNPFNDLVQIHTEGFTIITIIDLAGRVIYTSTFEDKISIATLDWPAGCYLVELTSKGQSWNTKIVK